MVGRAEAMGRGRGETSPLQKKVQGPMPFPRALRPQASADLVLFVCNSQPCILQHTWFVNAIASIDTVATTFAFVVGRGTRWNMVKHLRLLTFPQMTFRQTCLQSEVSSVVLLVVYLNEE